MEKSSLNTQHTPGDDEGLFSVYPAGSLPKGSKVPIWYKVGFL